jgi:hypothetical protein
MLKGYQHIIVLQLQVFKRFDLMHLFKLEFIKSVENE